jgi:hypothetical protein
MGLGACSSSVVSLVAVAAFAIAQLLPVSPAAAQAAPGPNDPPPAAGAAQPQPGYPPQPQPGYPPPGYQPPPPGYQPPPPGYQQPGYPPQPYAAPQRLDSQGRARPPRRPKGLLIAGPIVFAATYGFTALVGLQMMNGDVNAEPGTYCVNCDTVGPRLLIPIIGPWLAMPEADGDDGKAVTAILGIAQATGVLLTIIGISRYVASGKETATARRGGVNFAFVPSSGGGFGLLGGSF